VPTRHAVADAMLTLAGTTPADLVYDLGSGDGRIVVSVAQKYGARGVGVEIQPHLIRCPGNLRRGCLRGPAAVLDVRVCVLPICNRGIIHT
jgi:hypothetical protein